MTLYLVWGIEFHVGRTLFGVYESSEKAYDRFYALKENGPGYDEFKVEAIELNADL